MSGIWQSWLPNLTQTGSVAGFGPLYTDVSGEVSVSNGRLNANWEMSTIFDPPCYDTLLNPPQYISSYSAYINMYNSGGSGFNSLDCEHFENYSEEESAQDFLLNSPYPTTITIQATSPLTTNYGMPILYVYGPTGTSGPMATAEATSVAAGSTAATFPFPVTSTGAQLPPNMYSYLLVNQSAPSVQTPAGHQFGALAGTNTSFSAPFGVAAAISTTVGQICVSQPAPLPPSIKCDSINSASEYPIVTEYNLGSLKWNGVTVAVGTHPTVVRIYGSSTTKTTLANGGYLNVTQPNFGLAVNTGSNTVSVVNLVTDTVAGTIPVGTQPVDAVVSASGTAAYVINYGSSTLSIINLGSLSVTATVPLITQPTSIALDSSGNAWIGGNGFIEELNTMSDTIVSQKTLTGRVNAIAFSPGQSQVVASFDPTSASSGVGTVSLVPKNNYSMALNVPATTSASSSYRNSALASELIWPGQLGAGALVSNSMNNDIAITASGNSFTVSALQSGRQLISGGAPGTIRGFAVAPDDSQVYLTVPDQNIVIIVPVPALPTLP